MPSHKDDRTRLDAGALQEIDSVADMPSLFLWLTPEEQEERARWLSRMVRGDVFPRRDEEYRFDPFKRGR